MFWTLYVDGKLFKSYFSMRCMQYEAERLKRDGFTVRVEENYPSGKVKDITDEVLGASA